MLLQAVQGCEMADRPNFESAISFTPTTKSAASNDGDQLEAAGQAILKLLHKGASAAEENSRHALEREQELSHQLRAATDRIVALEADVQLYREKAERAEQWLHKVYTEVEERLIRQPEEKRQRMSRP
jgi:molecular chaperone GrpE (heat shock protein)